MSKVTITLDLVELNKMIASRYTEDSDLSDVLLRDQKDAEEFVNDAIENKLFPPSTAHVEQFAYELGLRGK